MSLPIEIAYGDLVIHDAKMGCDLRPIDPAHPRAGVAAAALSACAASHAAEEHGEVNGSAPSYYGLNDLPHFGDVGKFAGPMMNRFWAYDNGVFGNDSAVTKREKALVGLAVAHSTQCPYCIDSFTGIALDAGATIDAARRPVTPHPAGDSLRETREKRCVSRA